MIPPRSTLRLQLHAGYTLEDAAEDLPYFSRLGVSHLYLSPVTRAVPGSNHGYDVVDHTSVDPERGGVAALRALADEVRSRGMGLLLDIVPNHMATHPDNAWWWDVLANGPGSAWADWFDIDWQAPELEGKVLAPFLGKPYEDALREGDIRLRHDDTHAGFHMSVHGVPYPVAPGSLAAGNAIEQVLQAHDPARPEGRQRLHELLEHQHYRLAKWQQAAIDINWRRFFEVSGLIGVRVEREEVFQAVHALPLQWYAEGVVDGLRIDHVDGLAFPLAYCRRLRAAMVEARGRNADVGTRPPWVVVEKILAPGEELDDRWEVSGTTGYDFMADVGGLLDAESGAVALSRLWAQVSGDDRPAAAWLVEARQTLLDRHFVAERRALLEELYRLFQGSSDTGERTVAWTREQLGESLDALLRHFPVYRTYVEGEERHEPDQVWFDKALSAAMNEPDMKAAPHPDILRWLDAVLGGRTPQTASAMGSASGGHPGSDYSRAIQRFQQLTPPLAAKSLEDTVFYRYGRLLSCNEVGSDPEVFSVSITDFHQSNILRAASSPWGLLATATHDHKRGEDVRARLAVLSEIPEEWGELWEQWSAWGHDRQVPAAVQYMMLQMLVGAWPPGLSSTDTPALEAFLKREGEWLVKALREGKQFSSWFDPDSRQEEAGLDALHALAGPTGAQAVLAEIENFVRRIEIPAVANGLIQTVLRLTSPGVPDLYQGTEFRDFSLVDPDNRRPVDYAERAHALAQAPEFPLAEGVWPAAAWLDGRVKQALIARLLQLRQLRPADFEGTYTPLDIVGAQPEQVLAFRRGSNLVVVVAVKCVSRMFARDGGMPELPPDYWGEALLPIPEGAGAWKDVLRGTTLPDLQDSTGSGQKGARLSELLAGFPVAVLYRDQG